MIYDDHMFFNGSYQKNNGHKYKVIDMDEEILIVLIKYFSRNKMNKLETVTYQNQNCSLKYFMRKNLQGIEYINQMIDNLEYNLWKTIGGKCREDLQYSFSFMSSSNPNKQKYNVPQSIHIYFFK